jgi:hypothetical protein
MQSNFELQVSSFSWQSMYITPTIIILIVEYQNGHLKEKKMTVLSLCLNTTTGECIRNMVDKVLPGFPVVLGNK